MGAGTGGTISGIAHYLKPRLPKVKIILADPQGSGLLNKVKFNTMYSATEAEGNRKRHQIDTIIEGVGLNRLTSNFKHGVDLIDDAVRVTDQEAAEMSRYLLKNDGIFCGSSSAVNCVAALKTARKMGPGHVIVTLLCDSGSRHLTKFYNDELLSQLGIDLSLNVLRI
jgi:cysteine synthase A